MTRKNKRIIFYTTFRDDEQRPSVSMTRDEKVRVAKILEKLQVDVIEAGFAISSQGDFESVRAVAEVIKDSTVCSLARAIKGDIERAGEAIKPPNLDVFTYLLQLLQFLCRYAWPAAS